MKQGLIETILATEVPKSVRAFSRNECYICISNLSQTLRIAMRTNPRKEPNHQSAKTGYLSISEIHEKYRKSELSPSELIKELFSRIEVIDTDESFELMHETLEYSKIGLCAIIDVDESSVKKAEKLNAERGENPLFGIPFIVKDNIEVEGWGSTAGSDIFDESAENDADVIQILKKAGAIPIASANLTEWAAASTSEMEDGFSTRGGLTGNPWALDRSAGSSSSGSAASVAAGYAPFSIGTETVGSVAMPASHCGVFAMKATRGAISTRGIIPYSKTQDVPGVFARNLKDLETVMSVLLCRELKTDEDLTLRYGVDPDLEDPNQSDGELFFAYSDLCESLEGGATPMQIPRIKTEEYERMFRVLQSELREDLSEYLSSRPGSQWKSIEDALKPYGTIDITTCAEEPPREYNQFVSLLEAPPVNSLGERKKMETYFHKLLTEMFDAADVIMAVAYGPAQKLDLNRGSKQRGSSYMSFLDGISSAVGWPALNVPYFMINELPVGLIFVAKPGKEEHLFVAARKYLKITDDQEFPRPYWNQPQRG